MELGPCRVYFGDADAEVDLGKTEGDVIADFLTDVSGLFSDQDGSQPADGVITGQGVKITIPLATYSMANLARALNQSVTRLGDTYGVSGNSIVGTKLSSLANSLLVKKYVDGIVSTDTSDWLRFPAAAPTSETLSLIFGKTTQRIVSTTFIAQKDDNDRLYILGDEDAATSGS